ncbi:GDSL esterase/lipase At5g03610 [Sorghum bicolor]|nr:GDSL esterase/lipase At5g03610 [Sorghum bicolor]|eukprot:XP_002450131.2 GDSL esterase/lipase At5g03610 [Sorghum bicolor]
MCFLLLLILDGGRDVECRRHRERRRKDYTLFVFGDSFVDAGNLAKSSGPVSRASRGWYYPYGSSDSSHANQATGRLSDGLVQSDYLAQMLGMDESPPVFSSLPTRAEVETGVNFAVPFSGVMNGRQEEELSLREQISQFGEFVDRGSVDDDQLENSVALLSVSNGHDYSHASDTTSQLDAYIEDVTDGIVEGVKRLQGMGVSKVVVNSMPPLGCSPWRARQSVGYAQCDDVGNTVATTHNTLLRRKLDGLQDVLVLDLYSTFDTLARSMSGSTPCCDTSEHKAYCGQVDGNGRAQYTVCANPDKSFYWDNENPTQAGWEAVMDRLQANIQNFLAAA